MVKAVPALNHNIAALIRTKRVTAAIQENGNSIGSYKRIRIMGMMMRLESYSIDCSIPMVPTGQPWLRFGLQ